MKLSDMFNKVRKAVPGINRRRQKRFDVNPPIHCKCLVHLAEGVQSSEVSLINVSEGGFFIVTGDNEIPVGTLVEFEFESPGGSDPIVIQGKIVRTHKPEGLERYHRSGVKFEYINKKDLKLLFEYV